jgi:hypothetical protein
MVKNQADGNRHSAKIKYHASPDLESENVTARLLFLIVLEHIIHLIDKLLLAYISSAFCSAHFTSSSP